MSSVLFFFYFPTKQIAEKFYQDLQVQGFAMESIGEFPYDPSKKWALRVTKMMDSDTLINIDRELTTRAAALGGIYDGYER
jgi:hypothetical protein